MHTIPKILIVEDEKPLRQLLVSSLEAQGYDVEYASNGELGLHKALSLEPDLIILDNKMPVLSGVAMLAKLRAEACSSRVLILSGDRNISSLNNVNPDGANYLIKSETDLSDILTIVDGYFRLQPATA